MKTLVNMKHTREDVLVLHLRTLLFFVSNNQRRTVSSMSTHPSGNECLRRQFFVSLGAFFLFPSPESVSLNKKLRSFILLLICIVLVLTSIT